MKKYTLKQALEHLKVSRSTFYRRIKNNTSLDVSHHVSKNETNETQYSETLIKSIGTTVSQRETNETNEAKPTEIELFLMEQLREKDKQLEANNKQFDEFLALEKKFIEYAQTLQAKIKALETGQKEIKYISVAAEETSFENVSDTTETQKEPTEENIMQSFVKAKGEKRAAILKENKEFEKSQPRSMSDWLKDLK